MGSELMAIYYISGKEFHIYGCWEQDTPKCEYEFYDIYLLNPDNKQLDCINMGDPCYEFPPRNEVKDIILP